MANKVYLSKTVLTGGAATALDVLDGAALVAEDIALVWVSNVCYAYRLSDAPGPPAESSPTVIAPDTNAGNKRWILQPAYIQPGAVVQTVYAISGAVDSGTTAIPVDDTIPQSSEGDEYLTLAITPKSASNLLIIDINCQAEMTASANWVCALFQDATAGALAVVKGSIAANGAATVNLRHVMVSGTTSATTFKQRMGPGSGTLTMNGANTSRLFGGVAASSMTIMEIKV
jgi:hypothetical protein